MASVIARSVLPTASAPAGARFMSGKAKALNIRMKSVTNIGKITKSMKMVAAAKLRHVQSANEQARPFNQFAIGPLGDAAQELEVEKDKKNLLVVVSSDRGLCGAVNSGAAKQARLSVAESDAVGAEAEIFVIGDKGKAALQRDQAARFVNFAAETGKNVATFNLAMALAESALQHKFDVGTLIYNKFISAIQYEIQTEKLFSPNAMVEKAEIFDEFEFDTPKDETLANMYQFYIASSIFKGLLENATSEMSSRMSAMDNASRNASDMLEKLTLEYNKIRQSGITTELIEIISGAEMMNG